MIEVRKAAEDMRRAARQRAKEIGVPFGISQEDVLAVWPADNVCPVLGIKMERGKRGTPLERSPSLDRIVPSVGYVPGNIAVMSRRANSIKSNATAPEIEAVAAWLRVKLDTPPVTT